MRDSCEDSSLNKNVAKTKTTVFKKAGKPSGNEEMAFGLEEIEIIKEIK
jgi:hypothetical protein